MRTKTLHEFVHLSTTLNFTRTAKFFGISQPALSNRIAALEEELGFPLFDRTESVSLTEEGRAFLKEVVPLLDRLDDAVERCRAIHQRHSRTLVIETVPGNEAVLRLAHNFKRNYPEVDLEIADLNGSSILERIQSDKTLCGLFLPTVDLDEARKNYPNVSFVPIEKAEMLVWVDADSPLGHSKAVTPEELAGYCLAFPQNLYSPMNEEGMRWLAHYWGNDMRVEGRYARTFDEFVFNGIQDQDVLALLSCFSRTSACNIRDDRVWKSFDPPLIIDLYLAYRADSDDPSLRKLVGYLKDCSQT